MKKIIALSLILISFTTHAKIYELNTQTFVENNIIKHIPDYSSYPSVKRSFDDMITKTLAQHIYQYTKNTCQQLGAPLQEDDVMNGIHKCSSAYQTKCSQISDQCSTLTKNRYPENEIQSCNNKYNTCKNNISNMLTVPMERHKKYTDKWINDFYIQNKQLAQPYTGKLYSKDKTHLLIIEKGVQKAAYPITEIPADKSLESHGYTIHQVYTKEGRFYALLDTPNHEQDKPFSGEITIHLKPSNNCDQHDIATIQKYLNGKPEGLPYQKNIPNSCVEKPIIYLYPQEETEVMVKMGYPKKLTHTYPKYPNDGWHILAKPTGDLIDLKTKRNLYALYWEGHNTTTTQSKNGFIVKGEDTIPFLEEKLAQLGLTEREAEEFIIYWLPKLEKKPYNLIRFESISQQNENMPLHITPKPDTLIRVLMVYKPLEKKIDLPEQILPPTPTRTGFTVVEWGGTELNYKQGLKK